MNKYNLRIIVPIINKKYDIFIPNNILVGNLLYMLINSINEMYEYKLENLLLYKINENNNISLDEYILNIIKNGETLILK